MFAKVFLGSVIQTHKQAIKTKPLEPKRNYFLGGWREK